MQGNELKALRKAAGLTQADLGAAIGMSQKFIGMMERGDAPIERRTELAVRHIGKHANYMPYEISLKPEIPLESVTVDNPRTTLSDIEHAVLEWFKESNVE